MAKFGISPMRILDAFFKGEVEDLSRKQYFSRMLLVWVYWALWLYGCYFVAKENWSSLIGRISLSILLILTTPAELPFISYQRAQSWFSNGEQKESKTDKAGKGNQSSPLGA